VIGESRTLQEQSRRAQQRWGYDLEIDLRTRHEHDQDAVFANYREDYKSRKELAAEEARQ
jgi:hypothetical protein